MSKHVPKHQELSSFRLQFRNLVNKDTGEWERKDSSPQLLNWRKHLKADIAAGLSLGEMARRYSISRQAVHKNIKRLRLKPSFNRSRTSAKEMKKLRKSETLTLERNGSFGARIAREAEARGHEVSFDETGKITLDGVPVRIRPPRKIFQPNAGKHGYYREKICCPEPALYVLTNWGKRNPVWLFGHGTKEKPRVWYASENMHVEQSWWPTPAEVRMLAMTNTEMAFWHPDQGLMIGKHFTSEVAK